MNASVGDVRQWRVRRDVLALKAVGLAVALVLFVLNIDDLRAVMLCSVLVVGLGVLVARDLVAPVRLAADGRGISVVRGFSRMEWIDWDKVEHISVDVQHRYGRRWEHMEIDTGDRIYVLSSASLGESCTEAAAELRRLRAAKTHPDDSGS
ncbi:hypothetical protein HNP84_005759 [Thermocatellispora tengchongensis]|uniref:Low molecular weight protein antigen 6 PH domain-containing protein n=1 Tax=Thermocatellispora tengchongensis TaxID=1073253 RepID=A0A840PIW6_9ACTN|nr:PH domain-containing protein [Thermocatellispora tengchongensis]MBB5136015.1 hypothetical protein [Thermocatellispora tengchongensis]